MAYSFSDLYRPLRISMRVNGVVVGLVCGLLLLWGPKGIMDFLRISENEPMWPIRLAGAALIGLGVFLIMASGERIIHPPMLISVLCANILRGSAGGREDFFGGLQCSCFCLLSSVRCSAARAQRLL